MERRTGSGLASVEAEQDGTFVLRIDGSPQSQVDLADPSHLSFEYMRRIGDVVDAIAPRRQPIAVLHIGGAALSLPRYVAATRPRSRQIVLEPDEDLTEFVREALPLPKRSGIKVRPVTGRAGITELYDDSMDLMILDAFEHEAVPSNLVTAEFFGECARVLRPTGVLVANLIDGQAGLPFVRRTAATVLSAIGPGVALAERKILRGKGFGNVILLASPHSLPDLTAPGRHAQPPYDVTPLQDLAGKATPLTDTEPFTTPRAPASIFRT
ncbi:spermidine synthase [Kribbella aluminosa]|uniref:Spermidine synthase n=1 Tax=Kribbella aluminosa TaxID=416017 RepID=A0ABS4UU56_9ACTN|nr:fused MFS/spermidine synthase [Kribbella aluminosa]MBP2355163.1 spermidine synthase [Kribbella aluminosa]